MVGILDRAREAGIAAIVNVGTEPADNTRVVEFAQREPMVYAAVGFHPHGASRIKAVDWMVLDELARRKKVVALGEFGLDYHYEHSPRAVQKEVLAEAVRHALALDLPMVIHTRESGPEAFAVIEQAAGGRMPRAVFHCFTGAPDYATDIVDRGFYVSFAGVITFPSAADIREAARRVPLERLLVETDSPYCAPVPRRGRVNEPANLVHTLRCLAGLYGLEEDDVRRITTRNAAHLFGLPLEAGGPCLVYPIRRSLYVNVTNECSNRCTFCPRQRGDFTVKGHDLALGEPPTAEDIRVALERAGAEQYDEIVFCGFGEPTLRLEVIKEVARTVKTKWHKPVRLDTNGQGSAIHGRDIVPELAGLVDTVSVSLDAPDAATYEKLCRPTVQNAFSAVCDFVRASKGHIPNVRATAVAIPGLDLEAIRRLAEYDLCVDFEVRQYNAVG
jgi:TatD DNase family protein